MLGFAMLAAVPLVVVVAWVYFRFFWSISLEGVLPIPH